MFTKVAHAEFEGDQTPSPQTSPRSTKLLGLFAVCARPEFDVRSKSSAGNPLIGVFFFLTEEAEIQAKYEQNEVNDGALAADVGCLNRNGPCVRQHNRK
jgi:hypothetical protein